MQSNGWLRLQNIMAQIIIIIIITESIKLKKISENKMKTYKIITLVRGFYLEGNWFLCLGLEYEVNWKSFSEMDYVHN